jgi:D-threo-aldose 1-dehydrogenase
MNPLQKTALGITNVEVTCLGVGGAALGGLYTDVTEDAASATIHRNLSLGLNFFDTAPLYGHGKSELRLGKALAAYSRSSFVIATKVGFALVPEDPRSIESMFQNPLAFQPVNDFSYNGVMRSLEESLERLHLDRVDILHIHDPVDHYEQVLRETYPALERLRSQKVVRLIGAAMNQAEMLVRLAHECRFDCFLLAGRYTLIDHAGLRELLPLCLEKGISVIIGGPYNSGILATGARPGATFNYTVASSEWVERVRRVESVCARHSVPLKAAALQFPLGHSAVVSVIPGCRSVAEAEENFRLVSHPIPDDFWAELRQEHLLPEEAPVPRQ